MWLDGRSLSPCHRLNMKSNKEQSCNVQCLCVQKKGAQVVKLMHSWIVTVDAATRTCLCVHEEVSRTVRECTRLPQRHPLHHTIYGEEFQKLGREKSPTVHVKVSSTFRPRGGFPCQDGQPHSLICSQKCCCCLFNCRCCSRSDTCKLAKRPAGYPITPLRIYGLPAHQILVLSSRKRCICSLSVTTRPHPSCACTCGMCRSEASIS